MHLCVNAGDGVEFGSRSSRKEESLPGALCVQEAGRGTCLLLPRLQDPQSLCVLRYFLDQRLGTRQSRPGAACSLWDVWLVFP